jgi:hypothetical protein
MRRNFVQHVNDPKIYFATSKNVDACVSCIM